MTLCDDFTTYVIRLLQSCMSTAGFLCWCQNLIDKLWGDSPAGDMLNNLLNMVPELNEFANLHLKVAFNKDSSRVGPKEWVELAKLLHQNRQHYDAFLVVHGTDTMAYTASALSLMLLGFRKPIVMTGWLPCL